MALDINNPPETLQEKIDLLKRYKSLMTSPGPKGVFLRKLFKETEKEILNLKEAAKFQDPLASFKPSYEQSLILNSWLYGIMFNCVYTANRIGKTAACLINFLLWILPNKPSWKKKGILRPYYVGGEGDEENKGNPNEGKLVQVLPRPSIEMVKLIRDTIRELGLRPDPNLPHYSPQNAKVLRELQKHIPHAFKPAFPFAPWDQNGACWMGAPDHKHHKEKIMPIWRKYIPAPFLHRYVESEREIEIHVKGGPDGKRQTSWKIIGLSFEQDDTKFASGATEAILLTEGVPPAIFKEVKLRFTTPGMGSHDFTPYEAANTASTVALAKRIKTGAEGMPLPTHVFEKFSVYAAPRHILPEDKQAGLIKSFENDPEGAARLRGEFWTSSGLIMSNLTRGVHLLPWSIEEMFRRFPDGQIYRGVDPGLDHPTACVWGLLTRNNQWIIYRILSERGLDIPTRCQRIVELSHNKLHKKQWGRGPNDFYFVETHPNANSEPVMLTVCDYHTFKEDETTRQPYALNYSLNGLSIVESVHTGPEDRALLVDSLLKISDLNPNLALSPSVPPAPQVFFLQNGPGIMEAFGIWDEFYWDRIRSGDNKGQPKDSLPSHGDDEFDALSYLLCSPYRWTNMRPRRIVIESNEPQQYLVDASRKQQTKAGLRIPPQMVVFGGIPGLGTVEED